MHYEDISLGSVRTSSETYAFSADKIKSFASEWDPMPFHVDEDLAKATPLGALFASGAHVIATSIKLSHSMGGSDIAAIATLGWNHVRFLKPVLVGDTLQLRSEIVDKRESRSKPDRGIVTTRFTLVNQNDEPVLEYELAAMVLKKPRSQQ